MSDDGVSGEERTDAGEEQEADRQLGELTGELRVLLAATTVLFAFLLTVPFSANNLTGSPTLDLAAFFIAFICTALAVVLFVGEVAYHRLIGRPYDKKRLVVTASRQTIGGIVLLAVALTAVVFVVTNRLFPAPAGIAAAIGTLGAAALTWFALPLRRRGR